MRQNKHIRYVEQDVAVLKAGERKSYREQTNAQSLESTIRQMLARLAKDNTAWATVMAEKDCRGDRQLKEAGFTRIAWDRKSNHTVYIKGGQKGRVKDTQEFARQLELLARWKSGRDRKTTIYPNSFREAAADNSIKKLTWQEMKRAHITEVFKWMMEPSKSRGVATDKDVLEIQRGLNVDRHKAAKVAKMAEVSLRWKYISDTREKEKKVKQAMSELAKTRREKEEQLRQKVQKERKSSVRKGRKRKGDKTERPKRKGREEAKQRKKDKERKQRKEERDEKAKRTLQQECDRLDRVKRRRRHGGPG
jgi:hypothetical protein